jgi:large subunit ribosomal protein L4
MIRIVTKARQGGGLIMTMVSETGSTVLLRRNNTCQIASMSTIRSFGPNSSPSSTSSVVSTHLRRNLISPTYYNERYFHSTVYVESSTTPLRDDDDDDDDELPPNLKFDRKSSFAPKQQKRQQKQKPLLLVPPDAVDPISPTKDDEKIDDHVEGGIDDYIEEDDYDDDDDDDDEEDLFQSTTFAAVRPVIPLPDRLQQDILHGPDGTKSGTIWLDETVFGLDPIRIDLIKQSVDYIRNKIRGRRKAKSKTISEVSGSGRKVRRQKGTGQARAGHSRPAHWRGGAKAHGPKNTVDYGNVKMNKRARALAMRSTLSQKVKEGNLIVVDHLQLPSHKTKDWSKTLEEAYGVGKYDGGSSAFILDHYLEPEEESDRDDGGDEKFHASYHGVPINLWVASSNVFKVKVANQRLANVYDILKKEKLIITLSALEQMEKRWKDV